MRVTGHDLSWETPFLLFIGVGSLVDIPDNEGLISGSRDKEFLVGILGDFFLTNLHAGNPTVMSLKETSVHELVALLNVRHFVCVLDFSKKIMINQSNIAIFVHIPKNTIKILY